MNEQESLTRIERKVGFITLNRPKRLNSFTMRMAKAFISALQKMDSNEVVRAVVLTGAEPRAFSSGMDLEEAMAAPVTDMVSRSLQQEAIYRAVLAFGKPSVVAVDGICVGAGFHVALCADWRIATPSSAWGQPEVKVGIASISGPYLIGLHVGHGQNVQLSTMAELITGQRAYEWGLVTELCESDVLAAASVRAEKLAELPRTAVRLTKERFNSEIMHGLAQATTASTRAQLECYSDGERQQMISEFLAKSAAKRHSEAP
jgi:enoyl-CoA hydratase/carnithine racemase